MSGFLVQGPKLESVFCFQAFEANFEYLNKQLFAYEVEYQVMREEEILNSPSSAGGGSKPSVSQSATSSDLANRPPGSDSGPSSLQKHNEFYLEKVAALNKKLDREKYALELKLQQLKQLNYDLQVRPCFVLS